MLAPHAEDFLSMVLREITNGKKVSAPAGCTWRAA
jgi:hypothetical protein